MAHSALPAAQQPGLFDPPTPIVHIRYHRRGWVYITDDRRVLLEVDTAKGTAWLEISERQWLEFRQAVDEGLAATQGAAPAPPAPGEPQHLGSAGEHLAAAIAP
jgi:hypothetical protein